MFAFSGTYTLATISQYMRIAPMMRLDLRESVGCVVTQCRLAFAVVFLVDEFPIADADIHVSQIYASALNRFAVKIPADRLVEAATDPRVLSVEPDRPVYTQAQTLPHGANWIGAERDKLAKIDGRDGAGARISVDIAILDTWIAEVELYPS
jgi:hypothetical protein